jgi:predicted nucleotidyltransferase
MPARRLAWDVAARTAGGRVPAGAARRYYDGVTGSLVRALERLDGVLAVYAWGSYATGAYRPGRSDVDLVVVVADAASPEAEVALLGAIRDRYVRRQAVLPIDLTAIALAELGRDAGAHELIRLRAADRRPGIAPAEWRLLGGGDVRPDDVPGPDPALRYVSDARVQAALAALAGGRRGAARTAAGLLARLDEDAALDGPHRESAERLRAARGRLVRDGSAASEALQAALALVDEHRRGHPAPAGSPPADAGAWGADAPSDAAAEAGRRIAEGVPGALRSATVHQPAFGPRPVLLLEGADVDGAGALLRWAIGGGAAAADRGGLRLEVVTTRIAEDAWRSRALRWVSLLAGSRHVAGEPLAPRIAVPADGPARIAHYAAVTAVAQARWALLGRRGFTADATLPLRVAAARRLVAGEPPEIRPDALAPASQDLAALRLWHDWPLSGR